MSPDSQWDVQTALKAALDANTSLTALLNNGANSIFDHVPQGADYPYIVISEAQGRSWDTQTDDGFEQDITLHTYSRHRGMKETKLIMQAIYNVLHNQNLTVPNQNHVLCRFVFSETALNSDGLTRRGSQIFTILTEPTP